MDDLFRETYFPQQKKKKKSSKKKVPDIIKDIRDYKSIPIDYSTQKNISYSQLSIYNQCKKRWSLQYKEGNRIFTSSVSTVFGTSIHETIQLYLDTMYNKSGAEADRLNLEEIFENKLREEYSKQFKKNKNQHFVSPQELREHFDDGVAILNFLKKNRGKYFRKKYWHLVGCEIPLRSNPNPKLPNVVFEGFIDVVLYNELTESFLILDIKTSTRSWGDKQKKDKSKQHQLLLYKKYFSEQFNIPIELIDVEFFIVKRKIIEDSEFPQKRIQRFVPPSGKNSINQATKSIESFVNEAFDKNGHKNIEATHNPNPHNCKFCPFAFTQHCNKAVL